MTNIPCAPLPEVFGGIASVVVDIIDRKGSLTQAVESLCWRHKDRHAAACKKTTEAMEAIVESPEAMEILEKLLGLEPPVRH